MNKLTALLLASILALIFAIPVSAKATYQLQPQSLSFGRQQIGACDTADTLAGCKLKALTLTNNGSVPVTIRGVIFSDLPLPSGDIAFGLGLNSCITTLLPGQSCELNVTATPLLAGRTKGEILFFGADQFDIIAVVSVRTTGI